MSDNFLRVTPSDPELIPTADARESALALLRSALPEADAFRAQVETEVVFVDAGGNFESVSCPICERPLDDGWWSTAMERASGTGFSDLSVELPCCGGSTSLNELRYRMPQGFARCVLEIMNPHVATIPERLATQLREALCCELRFVWAHY